MPLNAIPLSGAVDDALYAANRRASTTGFPGAGPLLLGLSRMGSQSKARPATRISPSQRLKAQPATWPLRPRSRWGHCWNFVACLGGRTRRAGLGPAAPRHLVLPNQSVGWGIFRREEAAAPKHLSMREQLHPPQVARYRTRYSRAKESAADSLLGMTLSPRRQKQGPKLLPCRRSCGQ